MEAEWDELVAKIKQVKLDIATTKSELNRKNSLSAQYWEQLSKLETLQARSSEEFLKKRTLEYDGTPEMFLATDEAQSLKSQQSNHELSALASKNQAALLSKSKLQYEWLKEILSSTYKVYLRPGKRLPNDQSEFKKRCKDAYHTWMPGTGRDKTAWCCITRQYHTVGNCVAAHIFPYAGTEETMEFIFGADAKNEMFSHRNGLLVFNEVEQRLDKGLLALKPDIPDDAGQAEWAEWNSMEIKEYKIEIMDHEHKLIDTPILANQPGTKTWSELDGERVEFKSNERPRARYLFWQYCVTLIRKSNRTHDIDLLKSGKPVWGTSGPYLREGAMQAMITMAGHDELGLSTVVEAETTESQVAAMAQLALGMRAQGIRERRRDESGSYFDDNELHWDDEDNNGGPEE